MKVVLEVKNEQDAAYLLAVAAHEGYISVPIPHPKVGWAFSRMHSVLITLVKEVDTCGESISVPD